MGKAFTWNGTLAKTTSSFARHVQAVFGVATPDRTGDFHQEVVIRKGALDSTPDTVLPVTITLPVTVDGCLVIRAVNVATLKLFTADKGSFFEVTLGAASHPEGFLCLFGVADVGSVDITSVTADGTVVEVWALGELPVADTPT